MRSAPRPESGDELAHLGLGRVAARGGEGVLGLGEAGDRSLGGVLLHGDPQLLEPEGGLVEAPARQDVGQTGAGGAALARPGGPGSGNRAGPGGPRCRSVGGTSPPSTLSRLVLPAPLRPTRPTLSPARTSEGRLLQSEAAADLHAQLAGFEHPSMIGNRPVVTPAGVQDYTGRAAAHAERRCPSVRDRWMSARCVRTPAWPGACHAGLRRVPSGGAGPPARRPSVDSAVEQPVGRLLGPPGHLPHRQPEQAGDPGGVVVLGLDPARAPLDPHRVAARPRPRRTARPPASAATTGPGCRACRSRRPGPGAGGPRRPGRRGR